MAKRADDWPDGRPVPLPAIAIVEVIPLRFIATRGIVRIVGAELLGEEQGGYALCGMPRFVRLNEDTILDDEQVRIAVRLAVPVLINELVASGQVPPPQRRLGVEADDVRRRTAVLPIVLQQDQPASFAAVALRRIYRDGVPYAPAVADPSDPRSQAEVEQYLALVRNALSRPSQFMVYTNVGTSRLALEQTTDTGLHETLGIDWRE
jgi:hypothetical protein